MERKMLDGCGDGSCVVVRPVGMHTNGGCRCFRVPENAQKFRAELAGLKESHAGLCAQVERLLPVVHERDNLLLQVHELQDIVRLCVEQGGLSFHVEGGKCPEDDTCDCPDALRVNVAMKGYIEKRVEPSQKSEADTCENYRDGCCVKSRYCSSFEANAQVHAPTCQFFGQ